MSETILRIDSDGADVLREDPAAVQLVSQHRWYTKQLIVVTRAALVTEMNEQWPEDDAESSVPNEDHFGFFYLEPASELQEDQDRYESDPVKVYVASGTSRTMTIWNVEEQSA
jgi:hypothetical protein